MDADLKFWVGFSLIPGIGRVRFSFLEKHFGQMERAWFASAQELKGTGLEPKVVETVLHCRPRISLDKEMEKLERYGVQALPWRHPAYPPRLKEIYDPPPVLFVRGSVLPQDEVGVSVVGTRKPTIYGRQVTEELVAELVRNRITIISGLARGIDAVAHRTALSNGGRTIAVFASGLDTVYPAEHSPLVREVLERGALGSELPLGTPPRAEHFPRRNRIISGMALGTVVVEAGEGSGALITARLALEQNREVFAIPGSILSPQSRGANRLIQEGAKLVMGAGDILEELNLAMAAPQAEMKELLAPEPQEAPLLRHLSTEPLHIDELCRLSGLAIPTVSSLLSIMELKGMVRQVGAMHYILSREAREEYRVKVE